MPKKLFYLLTNILDFSFFHSTVLLNSAVAQASSRVFICHSACFLDDHMDIDVQRAEKFGMGFKKRNKKWDYHCAGEV